MTPEQWEKVSEIFHAAGEIAPEERNEFLDKACAGDKNLRVEVESLLWAEQEAGDFIRNPIAGDFTSSPDQSQSNSLIGAMLGHYRVEERIGSGGMGDVFLATDTRLNRKVALKTLPAVFANDENFLKRFRNEAQAAATLNHPNVATIYSVEDINGRPVITMEYVEGKTLDALTPETGIEIDVFLEWFRTLADALVHAHENGIIHRDIKPGNIMITADGVPKILDFGLARIETHSLTNEPEDIHITHPGQIIGTPSYMSPEQAEGKQIDQRTDIFSFGVVMYEALTGRKPFTGNSHAEVVSNLLKVEPPTISALRVGVPETLRRLIEKCLSKKRRNRYQTMREVRAILREIRPDRTGSSFDSFQRRLLARPPRSPVGWIMAGIFTLIVLTAAYFVYTNRNGTPPINFEGMSLRKLSQSNNVGYTQISPDGRSIAYGTFEDNDNRALWIRRIDDRSALQIVPPQRVSYWGGLAISEDGGQVYYLTAGLSATHGTLYRVSSLGGPSRKLADMANDVGGLSPDGQRILFVRYGAPSQILSIITSDGSGEQVVHSGPSDGSQTNFRDPQYSPDGRSIYYIKYERIEGIEYWSLAVLALDGGKEKEIFRDKDRMGEIAVLRDSSGLLVTANDPVSNLQQIYHVSLPDGRKTRVTNDLNFYFGVSVDRDGRNIVTAQREDENRLWVGEASDLSSLKPILQEHSSGRTVDWTPDGRIVFDAYENNRTRVMISDANGKNMQQLTTSDTDDYEPRVSGDGRFIVFTSKRSGRAQIWRIDIDGSNQTLLADVGGSTQAPRFASDGETVVFDWLRERDRVLAKVSVRGGEVETMPEFESLPIFYAYYWAMSPDGKYVAYSVRDEQAGQTRVAVRSVDGHKPTSIINIWPSTIFKWTPDSKSIFYRERQSGYQLETKVFKVDIAIGEPKEMLSAAPEAILDLAFSRDGKKAAVVRGLGSSNAVMLTTSEK